jgi:hypothetical protein
VQQRPHARQTKEKVLRRLRRNSKGTASVLGLNRSQAPQQLAGPEQLDLDGGVHVGLEVLHDLRRDRRGVQELAPRVPLDLGLLPLSLEMLVLDDPAGLAAIEKAEGGAEGCGRSGEPEDVAPRDGIPFFLFSHASMLGPTWGIVKVGCPPASILFTARNLNSRLNPRAFFGTSVLLCENCPQCDPQTTIGSIVHLKNLRTPQTTYSG